MELNSYQMMKYNVFTSRWSFLVESLGSYMCRAISSVNNTLNSSFLVCICLVSFACLIAPVGTSSMEELTGVEIERQGTGKSLGTHINLESSF